MNGSKAEADLVCYRPHDCCCINQIVLMLTSWYLNEKSLEVGMKARSRPALLGFIDQVTAHNYKIAYYYKTFLGQDKTRQLYLTRVAQSAARLVSLGALGSIKLQGEVKFAKITRGLLSYNTCLK